MRLPENSADIRIWVDDPFTHILPLQASVDLNDGEQWQDWRTVNNFSVRYVQKNYDIDHVGSDYSGSSI